MVGHSSRLRCPPSIPPSGGRCRFLSNQKGFLTGLTRGSKHRDFLVRQGTFCGPHRGRPGRYSRFWNMNRRKLEYRHEKCYRSRNSTNRFKRASGRSKTRGNLVCCFRIHAQIVHLNSLRKPLRPERCACPNGLMYVSFSACHPVGVKN